MRTLFWRGFWRWGAAVVVAALLSWVWWTRYLADERGDPEAVTRAEANLEAARESQSMVIAEIAAIPPPAESERRIAAARERLPPHLITQRFEPCFATPREQHQWRSLLRALRAELEGVHGLNLTGVELRGSEKEGEVERLRIEVQMSPQFRADALSLAARLPDNPLLEIDQIVMDRYQPVVDEEDEEAEESEAGGEAGGAPDGADIAAGDEEEDPDAPAGDEEEDPDAPAGDDATAPSPAAADTEKEVPRIPWEEEPGHRHLLEDEDWLAADWSRGSFNGPWAVTATFTLLARTETVPPGEARGDFFGDTPLIGIPPADIPPLRTLADSPARFDAGFWQIFVEGETELRVREDVWRYPSQRRALWPHSVTGPECHQPTTDRLAHLASLDDGFDETFDDGFDDGFDETFDDGFDDGFDEAGDENVNEE